MNMSPISKWFIMYMCVCVLQLKWCIFLWANYFESHNLPPLGPEYKEVKLNLFVCYFDAQNADSACS